MKLKQPYAYDVDAESLAHGLACPDDGMTQQQFAEECDINVIVARFGLTGELPQINAQPILDEINAITDYHSAMNAILEAQDAFDQLPATTRRRFDNNPGNMLQFLEDPRNREEAAKLGLVLTPHTTPQSAPSQPATPQQEPPK